VSKALRVGSVALVLAFLAAACGGHGGDVAELSAAPGGTGASATTPTTTAIATTTTTLKAKPPRRATASDTTASPTATDSSASGSGGSGGDGSGNGGLGPAAPGSVVIPYQPGQSTWSATSNGLSFDISMSPQHPVTGEQVTWRITVTRAGHCCDVYEVFGNGATAGEGTCGGGDSGSYTADFTTYYNKTGRHEFLVGGSPTGDCSQQGDVYGYYDVGSGTTSSQGPDVPTLKVDSSTRPAGHDNDFSWASAWGQAQDDDGYIAFMTLNWGDGSATSTYDDTQQCVEGTDGWPSGSMWQLPYGSSMPVHHYDKPGTYIVTETAVSTGCDGKDAQHVAASFQWVVPAPSGSPTPSP
jgi:hypothetical protein